jgi:hypothetical protein
LALGDVLELALKFVRQLRRSLRLETAISLAFVRWYTAGLTLWCLALSYIGQYGFYQVIYHIPNGGLQTNKVLVRTVLIYPWPRLINYLNENQYLMYTKQPKSYTPLHLHIRLFKRFQKGGTGSKQGTGGSVTWFIDPCFITTVAILLRLPLHSSFVCFSSLCMFPSLCILPWYASF